MLDFYTYKGRTYCIICRPFPNLKQNLYQYLQAVTDHLESRTFKFVADYHIVQIHKTLYKECKYLKDI